jgi:NAD(P)H-dependent FMN reductase
MVTDTAGNTATAPTTGAPTAAAPIRLAVIVGSTREGRFGPKVADWFTGRAALHADLHTDVIDLVDTPLPGSLSYRPGPEAAEALAAVTPRLEAADAFVMITPEYNHSYPASLKNAIDWHYTPWKAKPVGFVSYGGISGGLRAVEQLRQVFAEMHAVTVRDTVSFHHAGAHFDGEGRHKDPAACDAAAKTMLDQLAWWGHALRNAKYSHPYAG